MELQSNPNSLAYCVLEAKYFPNWDFVDATLGKRPSYTWRSIMAAQHIVRLGVRWRVGNGKNIQIWADMWLPTPSTFKVIKPQNTLGDYALVSDLIDSSLGAWKTELVRKFFLPHEANTIWVYLLPDDTLIWHSTANGIFSFRSKCLQVRNGLERCTWY